MKKILWICNIMLPVIAKELQLPCSSREGWLSGIFDQMTKEKEKGKFEIALCFPVSDRTLPQIFTAGGTMCYGFYEDLSAPEIYDKDLERQFDTIFAHAKPDMIHIFGTEFPHALASARAFGRPERTLIGIQGLCYEIARVYMAGLPEEVQKKVTFRDMLRKDSLKQQQEKFYLRGKNEIEAIRLAGHITGRTEFDRNGCARINKEAVYYSMNETMRSSFYTGRWSLAGCEKHSIFLGQGDYPLKGFHFLLQAMPEILEKYPDAVLYVSGNSVISHRTLKEKLKLPAYGKYLLELIGRYGLEDKVVMTGKLTEEEMKERFLKAHVFVCASVLENSPNTVGEAMLLGVPAAASKVGGIPDMIRDEEDGILFEAGNPKAIAKAVLRIFDETEQEDGRVLSKKLSENAVQRAGRTHDKEANYRRLLAIYGSILGE